MKGIDLKMDQVAPGRYVGSFPSSKAGSYMVLVSPGQGRAPFRTGDQRSLLRRVPRVGNQRPALGAARHDRARRAACPANSSNRPTAWTGSSRCWKSIRFATTCPGLRAARTIWTYLLLAAACLFFFDVFVRRVQVSFAWVPVLAARLLGRKPPAARRRDFGATSQPEGRGRRPPCTTSRGARFRAFGRARARQGRLGGTLACRAARRSRRPFDGRAVGRNARLYRPTPQGQTGCTSKTQRGMICPRSAERRARGTPRTYPGTATAVLRGRRIR